LLIETNAVAGVRFSPLPVPAQAPAAVGKIGIRRRSGLRRIGRNDLPFDPQTRMTGKGVGVQGGRRARSGVQSGRGHGDH
jgi:hypothetical protein